MRLSILSFQPCLIFILLALAIPNPMAYQSHYDPYQTVKIGLLIPDNKSAAAIQGAQLAIRKANRSGGFNGRPFQLVVRSMEGPWGTGSKQAVNLIFEEKVWALIGSHDGRNAHLVEQAATKATVVFMSAWAADPTLSQAFVPWFFNCVPNDHQQSAELVEEIYHKKYFNKVATVSDNDYDSKQSSDSFLRKIRRDGKPEPLKFLYESFNQNLTGLLDQINLNGIECIVLFCKPSVSYNIFIQIRHNKMNQPVFGSLYLLNENDLLYRELQDYDNFLCIPSGNWSNFETSAFTREYEEIYGKSPGIVAAYAFDGTNLLMEAIRNAGAPDREKIQKSLKNIYYEGVTGPIRFDDNGNRTGNFKVTAVKNGLPVTIE